MTILPLESITPDNSICPICVESLNRNEVLDEKKESSKTNKSTEMKVSAFAHQKGTDTQAFHGMHRECLMGLCESRAPQGRITVRCPICRANMNVSSLFPGVGFDVVIPTPTPTPTPAEPSEAFSAAIQVAGLGFLDEFRARLEEIEAFVAAGRAAEEALAFRTEIAAATGMPALAEAAAAQVAAAEALRARGAAVDTRLSLAMFATIQVAILNVPAELQPPSIDELLDEIADGFYLPPRAATAAEATEMATAASAALTAALNAAALAQEAVVVTEAAFNAAIAAPEAAEAFDAAALAQEAAAAEAAAEADQILERIRRIFRDVTVNQILTVAAAGFLGGVLQGSEEGVTQGLVLGTLGALAAALAQEAAEGIIVALGGSLLIV